MANDNGEFTEGTNAKLRLFDWYLRDWLPVFYSLSAVKAINIIDFFCGPGQDSLGRPGSPLIIMNRLLEAGQPLRKWGGQVNIHFNDIAQKNIDRLSQILVSHTEFADIPKPKITCEAFEDIFDSVISSVNGRDTANLILLDQYGVKSFTLDVFKKLTTLLRTDFLAFFSTEHLRRFADQPEMQKYHKELATLLQSVSIDKVSTTLSNYLRSNIPSQVTSFVSDFTIKKGGNAYTILFGSGHPRGVDKFIQQCWKVDPFSGNLYVEAKKSDQRGLFDERSDAVISKDLDEYQHLLQKEILDRHLTTTKQVFIHYVTHGFLNKHARAVLQQLKAQGTIERVPGISYESGYKHETPLGVKI